MKILMKILLILGIAFGLTALETWIVMLLWNHVVLTLWTTGPELTFWITYGLLILINVIGSAFKTVVNK